MSSFRDAIANNARVVAGLSDAELEQLLPILAEARDQQARDLAKWLSKVDREDKYTTAMHRQLVSSMDQSLVDMKKRLFYATKEDLQTEAKKAGSQAVAALRKAAIAGAKKFDDATTTLGLGKAQIVLDNARNLLGRHESSAARYAGRQGDEIKKQLAIGLVRGESVGSIVSRLSGVPAIRADRMKDGDAADAIAENRFFKSKADAERLVRTENVHAANSAQVDALNDDNERSESGDGEKEPELDDDGNPILPDPDNSDAEGGWMKRWDATFDRLTCEYCEDLDGQVVGADEAFDTDYDDDVQHPPLHPNCRCAVTPWREGWEL